jgi:SAM-dependent methyltransferase
VAVCGTCGAGWTLPEVSETGLGSFYPDSYHAYQPSAGALARLQVRARQTILGRALKRSPLDSLARKPPGAVLDVGCGRGDLGVALIRRGWRVSGIEPSASACAVARARGLDAHEGTLATNSFDEPFDAVVMNHSLEHVADPRADLARIFRLLRPNGVLALSVPNFASWQRRRFGAAWFPLDLPRHRTHFTPKALEVALKGAGFEVLSLESASDAGSLLATLQYARFDHLVLADGPAAWIGYAVSAVVSPVNRAVDRALGQGPLLHAVALRPANGSIPRLTG